MDEFRNKQSGKRGARPSSSIDGFLGSRNKAPRSVGKGGVHRNSSYQPSNQNKLDDFKRRDGFASNNRTRALEPGSSNQNVSLDEPLVITKTKHKKSRGIWPFRRKKNRNKPPMSRKRKVLLFITGLLVLLMLAVGFLVFKGYINIHKVLKGGGGAAALDANVDPSKLRGEGDGRVNILMLGRAGPGSGNDAPDLTDTIMLISIDPIAKEASILSVPRDLWVPVPGYGSMKINAAFSTGKMAALNKASKQTDEVKRQAEEAGFALTETTIERNLGVPVHYHAMIDFSGFKQAVDTVGGIDLNVPSAVQEQMRIDGKTYKLNVKAGQQHMDGFKALAYSRSRYTSARGDFDRSERQRLIMIALKQKIMSAGTFSNPAKISGLLDTLGGHVQSNFTLNDLTRLYDLGKQIDSSKITSIGLADPPNDYVTTGNIAGQSVVIPKAGAGNFKAIQGYLRNVLKDSFIRNENASVAVYNGTTTAGLASQKAEELKSYGYNITTVENAPTKGYTKTVLVDLRGGSKKYTLNYLEKRFGVTAVSSIPDKTIQPGTSDFVIILGSDQSKSEY